MCRAAESPAAVAADWLDWSVVVVDWVETTVETVGWWVDCGGARARCWAARAATLCASAPAPGSGIERKMGELS